MRYLFVLEKHRFSPQSPHYFDGQELKDLTGSVKINERREEDPVKKPWEVEVESEGKIKISEVRSSTKYPDAFLIKVDELLPGMEEEHVLEALKNGLSEASGYYQVVAGNEGSGEYLESLEWPSPRREFEVSHFDKEIKASSPHSPLQFPHQFNDDHLQQLSEDFLKIQPEYKIAIKWVTPQELLKKGRFKDHQMRYFTLPDDSENSKKFAESFNTFLNGKKYDVMVLYTKLKKPFVTVDMTASQEKNRKPQPDEIKEVGSNQIVLDFIVPDEQKRLRDQPEIPPLAQSLAKDIALGLDIVSEIQVTYTRRGTTHVVAFQIKFSGIVSRINKDELSRQIQEFVASGSPLFKLKGIGINLAPKYPSYGGLFQHCIGSIQQKRNAFKEVAEVKFTFAK